MNARIADNVGILKLKMLVMESIKEFPRGINSDQVISLGLKPTGRLQGVHPGPGLKLRHGGLTPEASGSKLGEMDIASSKPQASSCRRQAFEPTCSSFKRQASSPRQQASSVKPQAASSLILEPWYMDIGEVLGGKGPRAFTMINVLSG